MIGRGVDRICYRSPRRGARRFVPCSGAVWGLQQKLGEVNRKRARIVMQTRALQWRVGRGGIPHSTLSPAWASRHNAGNF